MWSAADIADAVETGVHAAASALDKEQAVYGLDSRDELQLQPLLAQCLTSAGYGVYREQRYPADRGKRRISEGDRCDFVLTPDGQPLIEETKRATLYEPEHAVELDDAYWLEVKVVAQFTTEGPNGSYASQLLSTVRQDVTKLSRDEGILHAGLLIMLFVANAEVASHDLHIWHDRALTRCLPVEAPARRNIEITDRIGNGMCALALFPVRHM